MHDSITDLNDSRYRWSGAQNGYDYRITPYGWQSRKQPPMSFFGKFMLTSFYISVIVFFLLVGTKVI